MGNRKNISVEIGSILVFALGVFTLFSILTYQSSDPSLFTSSVALPLNACGRVGAYLSSLILNCFGMGAFLFPALCFFLAAMLHKGEATVLLFGTLGGMTVSLSSLAVFLSLHWKFWDYRGGSLLTGGIFGAWVSHGLVQQLNLLGSSLLTLVVFCVSIVVSTPVSVTHWADEALKKCFQFLRLASCATIRFIQGPLRKQSARAYGVCMKGISTWGAELLKKEVIQAPRVTPKKMGKELLENTLSAVSEDPQLDHPILDSSPSDSTAPVRLNGDHQISILPREVIASSKTPQKPPRVSVSSRKGHWQLPTIEFLKNPPAVESAIDRGRLISNSQILKQKFADFGIDGEVTAVRPGPVITLYEFKPGPGVKVSRIAALVDDLSMALSAQSVRILAPLPGKSVVGIEIPSDTREMVFLREFLQHPDFYGPKHAIPVVMGKEIGGQTHLSDMARMPHLLCAGQTGSGKSVFMNGLICSLFYRFTPDELRMILVDPKFIEFRAYQDIPHLLLPVVDDPKQASIALRWAVREMERRYRILAKMGARNLASFNQKIEEMGPEVVKDLLFAEDPSSDSSTTKSGGDWIEAFEPDETGVPRVGKLPYIVIIIDELADLMMIAKKEVEISIARIAQKARAAGIHLVIATQRPSTDVVTGLIKANLPSRVSFQLASFVDSKTILDRAGAERLLGQGDMLFIPPGVSQTIRLHGAYLDDTEISKITTFLKSQGKPTYRDEILLMADEDEDSDDDSQGGEEDDQLFVDGVDLVKRSGHASASFLQRHLKIGYNRAARMIETMESRGIVGPQDGSRPREVLIR